MSTAADFFCSKCKKPYRWLPEYAGKVAQCTCGGVLQFPLQDPHPRDPLAIHFRIPESEDTSAQAPAPNQLPVMFGEVDAPAIALTPGISLIAGPDPSKAFAIRDQHVPFAMLIVSLFLLGFTIADSNISLLILVGIALQVGVNVGITLLGVMLSAKALSVDMGTPRNAAFKLCALLLSIWVLLFMAVRGATMEDVVMLIVWMAVALVLYGVGMAYLFRLSFWQLVGFVIIIMLTQLGARCALSILAGFMGSAGRALQ